MNKSKICDYEIIYDNNNMVEFCKKDDIKYYPFKGNKNMSGLISGRKFEKGLITKSIELRPMSY